MKITRTANAGILLETNGSRILIDGVSKQVFPYCETPETVKAELLSCGADLFLYTHAHDDHFDSEFAEKFKSLGFGAVIGPEAESCYNTANISVKAVATRHIGKCDINHASFIINADKALWFMGDASPACLKELEGSPDVLVAPFAYVSTEAALKRTVNTGAKHIIILHLPEKEDDVNGLRQEVLRLTEPLPFIHILEMGGQITIN